MLNLWTSRVLRVQAGSVMNILFRPPRSGGVTQAPRGMSEGCGDCCCDAVAGCELHIEVG